MIIIWMQVPNEHYFNHDNIIVVASWLNEKTSS